MLPFFGYLSGLLILASFPPYIADIFRGTTCPERASWFIWALLGGISFAAQLAKGATNSLWLPGAQAAGDLAVFLLAIRYGLGGFKRRDRIALAVAAVGLLLWYLTREADFALLFAIAVDGAGAVLTILKSYEHPETETLVAWILTGAGGFFGILAVGTTAPAILYAFPVYTFLINCAIVTAVLLGRRRRH